MMDAPTKKYRRGKRGASGDDPKKRRCISSACVPCRRRKSKCDGSTPKCSACAAVYNTECVYDPNSDHRRKGIYRKHGDSLKTRDSTLQTLIHALLDYPEDEVADLVKQIRTCDSLDALAETITAKQKQDEEDEDDYVDLSATPPLDATESTFENHLSRDIGELRLEDGSTRYIGGTSVLIHMDRDDQDHYSVQSPDTYPDTLYSQVDDPICSWTSVTSDPELVQHLLSMYFCWHYCFFTTLSKHPFLQEFKLGKPMPASGRKMQYCTPLLVNAMLALGCHFTSWPAARSVRDDSSTAGDHFFKEAKRLIMEGDLHEIPTLTTVQALALMSVREAGCGREAKGWVYSGMAFRMACDLGLNLAMGSKDSVDEDYEDARRITFWGCFLFDKCWSNYLGRMPQLLPANRTVPKFDVFPVEDAETWSAITDSGVSQAHSQPSRTRAVALQISKLCEISSDLMKAFYNPIDIHKTKGKQAELKKLSEIHVRLETWRRELPKELEPKEGGLPHMLVMHMFFHLLYIHLFRPFLKYKPNNSPLPAHVSPRKLCTQAAAMIAKLLRLYKRSHGLRQICNICVYIAHSACTIYLLNLPEKNAKRDIIHGVKHLEEIAESWLCARRTLAILSTLARRWKVELPEEAAAVFSRTEMKFGSWSEVGSPKASSPEPMLAFRDSPKSPAGMASPSLQVYNANPNTMQMTTPPIINKTETAGSNFNNMDFSNGSSSMNMYPTPLDANVLVPPIKQHWNHLSTQSTPLKPLTPASSTTTQTHRSTDGQNTSSNSPSRLSLPGAATDQVIREGQDWIWQDQTQLASGFGNWNPQSIDDISSWFASTNAAAAAAAAAPTTDPSPPAVEYANPAAAFPAAAAAAAGGLNPDVLASAAVAANNMNGFSAPSAGNSSANQNQNTGFGLNLDDLGDLAGMSGNLQGFTYDERIWYEYQ